MVDNGDDNDAAAIHARILSYARRRCSRRPPLAAPRLLRSQRQPAPLPPTSAPIPMPDEPPSGCCRADAALCAASAARRPTAQLLAAGLRSPRPPASRRPPLAATAGATPSYLCSHPRRRRAVFRPRPRPRRPAPGWARLC
ncbi:hypothetical protein DAI22_04g154550 [Oryza sativa Japonica Group]|nr:hypothetical protein DAI22_04g154550 [Oryza sativa Japonica Group]